MEKLYKALLVLVAGFCLIACETDLKEPELVLVKTDYNESILIVNGISGLSDKEGVTVFSNGIKLNETPVAYAKTSESYIVLNKGNNTFSVKIGNTDVDVTANLNVVAGQLYTLYLCGTKESPEIVIGEDKLNFESVELKHGMKIVNLSSEIKGGLELEVYIRGYQSVVENGFHIACGPYGVLTNYGSIKGLPQILKYKEIGNSKGFPSGSLILPFPYRFVKAGTNTSNISVSPIPQSTGEYFAGQSLANLAKGNVTNTTLFVKDAYTTIVVAGNSVNNDRITFNYDNTELYNNK